jgi:hypothetical protein
MYDDGSVVPGALIFWQSWEMLIFFQNCGIGANIKKKRAILIVSVLTPPFCEAGARESVAGAARLMSMRNKQNNPPTDEGI